jgi:hypothetical protein
MSFFLFTLHLLYDFCSQIKMRVFLSLDDMETIKIVCSLYENVFFFDKDAIVQGNVCSPYALVTSIAWKDGI